MARIELSVAQGYIGWSLAESVREFIQNGLDAERDGHKFTVSYDPVKEVAKFLTEGATLTTRTLLLGATSKKDRGDQIGQFGEGYKLAVLALVNAGHPVVIRTGDERWTPSIEPSMRFGGERVLVIHQKPRAHQPRNAIEIVVGGIRAEQWEEIRHKFFCLQPPANVAKTPDRGEVILDTNRAGDVFVGGIWVTKIEGLKYGYNLPPHAVRVDRDRRMVERWDLDWSVARLWTDLCEKQPEQIPAYVALLGQGADDVRAAKYGSAVTDTLRKGAARLFWDRFGEGAIPVASEEEAEQARALGRKGVVVPEAFREVIGPVAGTLATAREDLRKQVTANVGIEDLTAAEAQNWTRAVTLVSRVRPHLRLAQFRVVEFPAPEVLGMWKKDGANGEPEILIARKQLTSFRDVLATVVHEVAHDQTGGAADASLDFEHSMQNLWADIVEHLSARNDTEPRAAA